MTWPRNRVAQTRLLAGSFADFNRGQNNVFTCRFTPGSKTDVLNTLVLDAEEHMWAARKDEAEGEVRKTGNQTFWSGFLSL